MSKCNCTETTEPVETCLYSLSTCALAIRYIANIQNNSKLKAIGVTLENTAEQIKTLFEKDKEASHDN